MSAGSALGWISMGKSRSGMFTAFALASGLAAASSTAFAEPTEGQGVTIAAPAPAAPAAARPYLPSWADIVERVSPAVVSLTSKKGLGSGFVIDPAGYVVTNNHVVSGSTESKSAFPAARSIRPE